MNTRISQRIVGCSSFRFLFATCLGALCLVALSTPAATITVTNTGDDGTGSLRQAIAAANNGDTIEFGVTGTIGLTTGELLVDKSIIINGPGSNNLTVDGNYGVVVFHVSGGVTATIAGVTITRGSTVPGAGGGIYNDHSALTVDHCTVSDNHAGWGGGIFNNGGGSNATLTITNSTFSGNGAAAPYGVGNGAAIYNDGFNGSATLTVTNTTFSGNFAGIPDYGRGGAIYNDGSLGSASVTVNNSTFTGNSAGYAGGGIYNVSGTVTIRHTILNAGALGENIFSYGSVTSLGYNITSDNGGGYFTATGDQINSDPLLGPLQDNGGPTFTHELLAGSPAIDAGDPNFTPPPDYDQRGSGFQRVVNGRVDIGAFEVQPPTPAYAGQVLPPINTDGTSVFGASRGVVPLKFTLTQGGVATCDLPPATVVVTRTGNGVTGAVNESLYSSNADTGSNFRIDNCQYVYNLNSRAIGTGIYRVDIVIDGQAVGSATFELR